MTANTMDLHRESLFELPPSGLRIKRIGRMLSLFPKPLEAWTGDCRRLWRINTFRDERWSKLPCVVD